MLIILAVAALVVVASSMLFSAWFEENLPPIFTETMPGRFAAVAFEQPAEVMVLVINAFLLPFAFLSELLCFPNKKGDTAEYWADLVESAVDYYTKAIPHFLAHGYFPQAKA